jgi:hypothetical protein
LAGSIVIAGLLSYSERVEQDARKAREWETIDRGLGTALEEADSHYQQAILSVDAPARWKDAIASAAFATKRGEVLIAGNAPLIEPAWVHKFRDLHDNITKEALEQRTVERLANIHIEQVLARSLTRNGFRKDLPDKYASVFADYGISLNTSSSDAAAHLRDVRPEVRLIYLGALYEWAGLELAADDKWLPGNRMSARQQWTWGLIGTLDDDSVRMRFREAFFAGNPSQGIKVADELVVESQPVIMLLVMAAALDLASEMVSDLPNLSKRLADAQLRLLQRAQKTYPGNFWVNYDLADAHYSAAHHYKTKRQTALAISQFHEALAFYRVAKGIRPKNHFVHYDLGNALYWQERFPEATQEFDVGFSSAPERGNISGETFRIRAAAAALMCASGKGDGRQSLSADERKKWLSKAYSWLATEIDLCAKALSTADKTEHDWARRNLSTIRDHERFDLARNPTKLPLLNDEVRREWDDLWVSIQSLLNK